MTTIAALPTAPARSQAAATFIANADAWVAALTLWTSQANTVAGEVNTNATNAAASAVAALASQIAAAASALAAASSAGAALWVSGTTYAIGNRAISTVNYQPYVRKTNGAGTTDPSADPANWQAIFTLGFNGQAKTANYTAAAGDQYMHDTTGGAFTATLPASPNVGDPGIPFKDQKGTFATNNLTVDPGANKYRGSVQTGILDIRNFSGLLVWTGSTWGWDWL